MRRVASSRSTCAPINCCSHWADPDQIAGLSPYAGDPSLSVLAAQAGKYPRLGWDTEYVINLSPDLVLVGAERPPNARYSGCQRAARRSGRFDQ